MICACVYRAALAVYADDGKPVVVLFHWFACIPTEISPWHCSSVLTFELSVIFPFKMFLLVLLELSFMVFCNFRIKM